MKIISAIYLASILAPGVSASSITVDLFGTAGINTSFSANYYSAFYRKDTIPTDQRIVSATLSFPENWIPIAGGKVFLSVLDQRGNPWLSGESLFRDGDSSSSWVNPVVQDSFLTGLDNAQQSFIYTPLATMTGALSYTPFTYEFSAAQVAALASYLQDGYWGFGIDSDAAFAVTGTATLRLTTQPVPDGGNTLLLMLATGIGCSALGRVGKSGWPAGSQH